jgi:hypothetical protein
VTRKEARETARADLDTLLLERVAQFAQEDPRVRLTGLQDERGLSLDAVRALVSALRLGSEAALLDEALVPANGAGGAHAEPLGGLAARGALLNGSDHTLAQVDGQG